MKALAGLVVLAVLAANPAGADSYPVDGTWTYDNASQSGPAKECGSHTMAFHGRLRFDTGTSAPDYKNLSVRQSGPGIFRVVDEFFTAVIWGRVYYTLRLLDADHIELKLDKGGAVYRLRRCA